jgi:hypothetical protein
LTAQFDIGSGIIVNRANKQSCQTDILIYDNRILPPFIKEQNIGVYPAESVIATVEIKTKLDYIELKKAEAAAKKLKKEVFFCEGKDVSEGRVPFSVPLCTVFGFEGGIKPKSKDGEKVWLKSNIRELYLICTAGKCCWTNNIGEDGWKKQEHTKDYAEVKRFVALLIDNIRFLSQQRFKIFVGDRHWDWLSMYIRD